MKMVSLKMKEILTERGIQPSFQRLKILKYLYSRKTHPTAEEIYKNLVKEIPTLSRTTVYNTLKTFVEKKIITALTIEDNEVRYDFCVSPHLHFKCRYCGKIYDIKKDCEIFKKKTIKGHLIEEYHLYLKGICKNCRKKKWKE